MDSPQSFDGHESPFSNNVVAEASIDLQEDSTLRIRLKDEKPSRASLLEPRKRTRRNIQAEGQVTENTVSAGHDRYKRRLRAKGHRRRNNKEVTTCDAPQCRRVANSEFRVADGVVISLCSICRELYKNIYEAVQVTETERSSMELSSRPMIMDQQASMSSVLEEFLALQSTPRSFWPNMPTNMAEPIPLSTCIVQSLLLLNDPPALPGPCQNPECGWIGANRRCLPIKDHGMLALCPECYKNARKRPRLIPELCSVQKDGQGSPLCTHPGCGALLTNSLGQKFRAMCKRCLSAGANKGIPVSADSETQCQEPLPIQTCEVPGCVKVVQKLIPFRLGDQGVCNMCPSCYSAASLGLFPPLPGEEGQMHGI